MRKLTRYVPSQKQYRVTLRPPMWRFMCPVSTSGKHVRKWAKPPVRPAHLVLGFHERSFEGWRIFHGGEIPVGPRD